MDKMTHIKVGNVAFELDAVVGNADTRDVFITAVMVELNRAVREDRASNIRML